MRFVGSGPRALVLVMRALYICVRCECGEAYSNMCGIDGGTRHASSSREETPETEAKVQDESTRANRYR